MRVDKKKPNNLKEHKINREIKARYVFLIGKDGQKIGNLSFSDALYKAQLEELDLVQIDANSETPVCKLMNYGKFCFEQSKNKKKSKKDKKIKEKKEIKINPAISSNDLEIKSKKVIDCLQEGHKVIILCTFKGRQMDYPEIGLKMVNSIIDKCKELCKVEFEPKLEGKRLIVSLNPILNSSKN